MPIANVQFGSVVQATGTAITATLSSSTAGNLLVVTIAASGANETYTFPASWQQAVTVSNANRTSDIWYLPNNVGSITSVAITAGTSSTLRCQCTEWSGVATSTPLDATGTGTSNVDTTSLTATTSGNVTQSGELGITSFGQRLAAAGTESTTPGSGWTSAGNNDSTSSASHFASDYIIGPSSGSTLSETETVGTACQYAGVIATFLASATIVNPGVILQGRRTIKSNKVLRGEWIVASQNPPPVFGGIQPSIVHAMRI